MSKFNIQLNINDENITNTVVQVVSENNDLVNIGQLLGYVITIGILFAITILWLFYTRKRRSEDPIWEEENEQYNTFQFGTMTILMSFIILSMILGLIVFMDISLFGKSTKIIVLFAFFISIITLSIRIITTENSKFEKAKDTVQTRRGLYVLLDAIHNVSADTFLHSKKDKIQELSSQYIDILRTEKFASTIRKSNQNIYSKLLFNLTKASLTGNGSDIINAQHDIKRLLDSNSFKLLSTEG